MIVEFGPGVAIGLLLRLHHEHWFVLGCHAPRNGPVSAQLAAAVEKKILSLSPKVHARMSLDRARTLLLQKYLIDDSLADLDLLPFEY